MTVLSASLFNFSAYPWLVQCSVINKFLFGPLCIFSFSLFICHKKYKREKKREKKSNYLDSHGEEAQKKPAGL